MSEYQLTNIKEGTLITVEAEEAAVVVIEDDNERIYLPGSDKHQENSYYTTERKNLEKEGETLSVVHSGSPDEVKVFSKD